MPNVELQAGNHETGKNTEPANQRIRMQQQKTLKAAPQWLGRSWNELKAFMQVEQQKDPAKWRDARSFGMVYPAGPDVEEVIREAHSLYFVENARHTAAFPSLRSFEADVVAKTASLFSATQAIGNVLSGGTEAALVVMKAVRDQARAEKQIQSPEIVLPATAYPVYAMAAHYLGIKVVDVGMDAACQADIASLNRVINERTIMIVGSAPGWPYGIIDPIAEMAVFAQARGVHLHVDACVGGYQIPFIRRLGHTITNFDFAIAGVSSIAADLHKFGYSAQGSAVLLYRDSSTYQYQGFVRSDWPMGTWSNQALLTSRPAGAVAASWAVMNYLGEDGYLRVTRDLMNTTKQFKDGIAGVPGLRIIGRPETSVFAFAADDDDLDIDRVGAAMRKAGWFIRQRGNASIHLVLTPPHANVVDAFLKDLKLAVESVRGHRA